MVILLLAAIIIRCFYVASVASDAFSSLVCVGYGGMLIAQVGLNIGMCLYVLPVIGITLPFFSYGGSSIITMYITMGIISGIRTRFPPQLAQGSPQCPPGRREIIPVIRPIIILEKAGTPLYRLFTTKQP